MTIPEICKELDEFSAKRDEMMHSPVCPPELMELSDRIKNLTAELRSKVEACLVGTLYFFPSDAEISFTSLPGRPSKHVYPVDNPK